MRDIGLTVCTDCALRLYARSLQGNDVVSMARILVTEAIAPGGLDRLRASGVSDDPIREFARHDIRGDPRLAIRESSRSKKVEKVVGIDVDCIRRRRVVRVQTPAVA